MVGTDLVVWKGDRGEAVVGIIGKAINAARRVGDPRHAHALAIPEGEGPLETIRYPQQQPWRKRCRGRLSVGSQDEAAGGAAGSVAIGQGVRKALARSDGQQLAARAIGLHFVAVGNTQLPSHPGAGRVLKLGQLICRVRVRHPGAGGRKKTQAFAVTAKSDCHSRGENDLAVVAAAPAPAEAKRIVVLHVVRESELQSLPALVQGLGEELVAVGRIDGVAAAWAGTAVVLAAMANAIDE